MAVKIVTREYVIGATGRILLSEILGRPAMTWIGSLGARASRDNSDDVFWNDEDGQRGGFIGPSEAITMDFGEAQTLIREFTFTGAQGDQIFLTIGMNTNNFDGVVKP